MTTEELIHKFNTQLKAKGKCGNVYFEANKLYDYGPHFLMAHILPNGAALINSYSYSRTTAKHLRWTQSALSNRKCFNVPNTYDPKDESNVDHLESVMLKCLDEVMTSKRYAKYAFDAFNEANAALTEYCYMFGFKNRIPKIPVEFLDELKAIVEVSNKKAELWEQNKSQRRKDAEAKRALEVKDKLDQWLACKIDHVPNAYSIPTYIRLKNDQIETTRGARVPLNDAIALFKKIEDGSAKQGDMVGDYTFNCVNNEQEIVIGCHRIDFDHAKTVMTQLIKGQN